MTRVGIRCDAGERIGVGHLARCVALAEELGARGVETTFLADLGGVAWAQDQLAQRGLPLVAAPTTPEEHVAAAKALGLDAVVLDGYHLQPGTGAALRASGVRVLALSDADFGDQDADLVLDQNLGGEDRAAPPGGRLLGGVRFALLRDDVRAHRPTGPPTGVDVPLPRVLCFFGGTDAYDAALTVVPLLLETGRPVRATAVAPRPESAALLRALPLGPGQELAVTGPLDDLAARVAQSDLVISASGTSTWELCCLGAATALVCVTDNQLAGYRRTLGLGVAEGLGQLDALRTEDRARDQARAVLSGLLSDHARRTELARRGWACVDGRGRERVADALLAGLDQAAV